MSDALPLEADREPEPPRRRRVGRGVLVYLAVYYAVIAAAVITLRRAGVLHYFPVGWTSAVVLVAVVLGGLLAWASRR